MFVICNDSHISTVKTNFADKTVHCDNSVNIQDAVVLVYNRVCCLTECCVPALMMLHHTAGMYCVLESLQESRVVSYNKKAL